MKPTPFPINATNSPKSILFRLALKCQLRWLPRLVLVTIAAFTALSPEMACADEFVLVHDEFIDGDAQDGDPAFWRLGFVEGNAVHDVVEGDLFITSTVDLTGSAWVEAADNADHQLKDMSVRAQVKLEGSAGRVWLLAQFTGGSWVAGYLWTGGGAFIEHQPSGERTPGIGTDFRVAEEDVVLQLDVIGDEASFYLWHPGQPMPDEPQLTLSLPETQTGSTAGGMHGATLDTSLVFRYLMFSSEPIRDPEGVETLDPNLEAAIRELLGKAEGDITMADLGRVTDLDLSSSGLTSLALPEGLTSLTQLNLCCNELTSLALPEDLTSLTELELTENPELTDYSFLKGLTNLTKLELAGNQLSDFSFLKGLTNLTELGLRATGLTSLTLPEGLTGLTTLDLGFNALTDLSSLKNLTSLTTIHLDYNALTSLTLPDGLTSLTQLRLSRSELTSLMLPEGLTSLTWLDLGGTQLTSLTLPESLRAHIDSGSLAVDGFPVSKITYYDPLPSLVVAAEVDENGFVLVASGAIGTQVTVEASTDLRVWELVAQFPLDPPLPVVWRDPEADGKPIRFYRATTSEGGQQQ